MSTAQARTPFQARCEDTIPKSVAILQSAQAGYTIDNTQSFRMLTRMQGPQRANAVVLGLTRTESRVAVTLDGPLLQDRRQGIECVAPHIKVVLYYAPIVVYVGREFAPNSCAYRHVLAHEMRHLKTYLDHLPKVESVVRAALARRFQGQPMYAPIGQAQGLLEREINASWIPFVKREMGKVEALQAAIDSPREYARLSKVCKGEVQSSIARARKSRS